MKKVDPKDYRTLLKEKLAQRLSLNQSYSQRAFARDLSISPGQLSLVLNGKKGISIAKAEKMLKVLGLSENELRLYRLQVAREHSRSAQTRKRAARELNQAREQSHFRLTQDAFEVISEWQHFAILQALALSEARFLTGPEEQQEWIARKLKLKALEVEVALDRLSRLELIELKKGNWQIAHDTVFTTDGVPSRALRMFHLQILKKAIEAIEFQTLEERYPNSIVLPIRTSDFPAIRADILGFQKRILKKYGRVVQGDGEQVYALTQQLFKLTE